MIFDHVVKYNDVYYNAGEDVPIGEKPQNNDVKEEVKEPVPSIKKYTAKELDEMSVKDMRSIAKENGYTLVNGSKKDIIASFLTAQKAVL